MIPRLHKRGMSFKGVCRYILHDPNKETDDRVLWADTLNVLSEPANAWREMHETARDQALLKQHAGKDARGRKNKTPVLHYTLSWATGENPSQDHMRATVLSSLKALQLEQHQALFAAHNDKNHLHVHVVVNTVHPETGMTASLKYTKEALSRWAEAYERENGIHVQQRLRNNELRENLRMAKHAATLLRDSLAEQEPVEFVPVKHKTAQREDWLDRKEIITRMRELRKEVAPLLPAYNATLRKDIWQRQSGERDILDQNTEAAVDHARTVIGERYRPQWRDLYRSHTREKKRLYQQATHPFERAAFVYSQRERLGDGKCLTFRQMVQLIVNPDRLMKRVDQVQQKERRALASAERIDKRVATQRIWEQHRARFETLRARQQEERAVARSEHEAQLRTIVTFDYAKESLLAERLAARSAQRDAPVHQHAAQPLAETFNTTVNTRSPAQMARVEAIKRQMEEWRAQHPGRDFGREL
ncbi:relaxase/mobilization nuclease domain-containing protein [uncultured Hyphomicrobium sp.]|jgi:hypothetical protein|uniref:relaxase/mobilization nuclease domain-containing protein n=1 Tax=uncultured Hyphomicrobium sp. TaxID=194373 RepID=UPI0025D8A23A|nr:relaxase/mobilization nuclease domain-containing protein [uncultured Hyphomicrobium sp.]